MDKGRTYGPLASCRPMARDKLLKGMNLDAGAELQVNTALLRLSYLG